MGENETLHDETEALMPRDETETFHRLDTSEIKTFKSRDRDVRFTETF